MKATVSLSSLVRLSHFSLTGTLRPLSVKDNVTVCIKLRICLSVCSSVCLFFLFVSAPEYVCMFVCMQVSMAFT